MLSIKYSNHKYVVGRKAEISFMIFLFYAGKLSSSFCNINCRLLMQDSTGFQAAMAACNTESDY